MNSNLQRNFFQKDSYIVINKQSYKVLDFIGKGQSGQVYKCKIQKGSNHDQIIAIKVILKEGFKLNPGDEKFLKREVEILSEINHFNVLRYIDFQDDFKYFYLLTEFCEGGNLCDIVTQQGTKIPDQIQNLYVLSEKQALDYLQQLLVAFKTLVDKGIMHRDLKFENIMISNNQVKLGDFGFSRILRDGALAETCCGSPKTMAPEISLNQSYNQQVDVYSLGIILYQMLFGTFPYQKMTGKENAELCKQNAMNLKLFNIQISNDTKELIQIMTQFDPEQRINFPQLFQKFNIDEVEKQMQIQQQQQSQQQQQLQKQVEEEQKQNISQNQEVLPSRQKIKASQQQNYDSMYVPEQEIKREKIAQSYQESFQDIVNISQFNQSQINFSSNAAPIDIAVIGEEDSGKQYFLNFFNEEENKIIHLKNNQKYQLNLQSGTLKNIKDRLACKGFILIVNANQSQPTEILKQYIKNIYELNGNNPKTRKRIYIIVNMIDGIEEKSYEDIFKICNEQQIEGEIKDIQFNQQGISNIMLKLVKKIQKVQIQLQKEQRDPSDLCCTTIF